MTAAEQRSLYRQYPYIVAHGLRLGSYDYYVQLQCEEAKQDHAPSTAIFKRDGKWQTLDEEHPVRQKEYQRLVAELLETLK